jgi:sarcosine oxidase subunit alpha
VVNDRLETNIPGIFSCGNVLHVHDLADYVTLEAYEAASHAARFIRGLTGAVCKPVNITAGKGVRYTVPSSVTKETGAVELMFRSDGVYKSAKINVYKDGMVIKSVSRRIITPGEMERVTFELKEKAASLEITIEN